MGSSVSPANLTINNAHCFQTDGGFAKPMTPPPTRSSSQAQILDAIEKLSPQPTGLSSEKRKRGRPFGSSSRARMSIASPTAATSSQETMPTNITLSCPAEGEVIETHFRFGDALYFIVYNADMGEANYLTRQFLAPVKYAVKPMWYMTGTPALQRYFSHKMKESDKPLVPEKDVRGDNAYAKKIRKLVADFRRCVVEPTTGDPTTATEHYEYSLNVPKDYAQLARHRLSHYRMDRIMSCACMPTSEDGVIPPITVYVVRWQNETLNELVPTEQLRGFSQHQHHHEVALDFWEEAVVQDVRMFRSAASVDFGRQETTSKTNTDDDFWANCVHQFRARGTWTDDNGAWSKKLRTQYVYQWIGWPMSLCWVSTDMLEGANFDRLKPEDDEDDHDPSGFDEFIQLDVYIRFPTRQEHDNNRPMKKVEKLSGAKLYKYCDPLKYTAHFPPNWRQMAEQHAVENDDVEVLAVVRQLCQANVYMVQWPSYDHPTIVPSLTIRKRHCRQLLEFFERTVYLPEIQILKPEEKQKPAAKTMDKALSK